jgi:N-acetylmuramoyl-L-alanine amidase
MEGYHFLILLDGTIQIGRPIGMVGAHTEGHNVGTVGPAYVGGLSADGKTAKDTRTPQQRDAAAWLVRALKEKFKIKRRVSGHNKYAAKACPSFNVAKDFLGTL